MKSIIFLFIILFTASVYSQNITGTLGTNGLFTIKDATNNYFTLSQSTGQVNILRSLRLEVTGSSSTTGVTFKGVDRFLHNFTPTGGDGYNTFLGINSGNFTMTAPASNNGSCKYNGLF
jgi:hypothetical protein